MENICEKCILEKDCEQDTLYDECKSFKPIVEKYTNLEPNAEFNVDITKQLHEQSEIWSCGAGRKAQKYIEEPTDHRAYNIGNSNYSEFKIQPWDIWKEYNLNPWDADIIKRVLRTKKGDERILDYEKIKHVCDERISQLKEVESHSGQ